MPPTAVEALVRLAGDEDPGVRSAAARALGNLAGAGPAVAVESLPRLPTGHEPDGRAAVVHHPTLQELIDSVVQKPEIWLNTPHPHLGDRKPAELIGTDEEYKVYNILNAVAQGLF